MVSRHLAESKCPAHTRPFLPTLGSGSMTEGPREDAEARWESRGAWRRAVGTEVVTGRTGHAAPTPTTHHVARRRDAGPWQAWIQVQIQPTTAVCPG